jgi:SAM-dependent methyltransferase
VIAPRAPLPFADGSFDFVFSNSVFSHLNEDAHRFCLAEIARCTRPGGLFIATTLGPRKLRRMYTEEKGKTEAQAQRIAADERELAAGRLVYRPGSRLPDYGLAFVPDGWTRMHWQPFFDVVDVNTSYSQDANVAIRRG